jgi:hypothetical protein
MIRLSNKADAPNPAMASLFQSGRHGRGVGDLRLSAEIRRRVHEENATAKAASQTAKAQVNQSACEAHRNSV